MENKKKFWTIFIIVSVLAIIPVVFLFNFWIYKAKNSYESITQKDLGGVTFEESRMPYVAEDSLDTVSSEEERSVIRTGSISFSVDDMDQALEGISDTGNTYGATVTNLNDSGKGVDRQIYLTIKVEESKFQELFDELRELDGEYEGSSISETDVTDAVMDLEARLKNYRSVEAQLLTILESAETVEDTLAVYKELNEVRYNVERVDAELENISNQTEYSYIYMYLYQSSTGAGVSEDEWRPLGIARNAIRALVSLVKSFGSVLIWLLVFSPVIGIIVGIVLFVKKKIK